MAIGSKQLFAFSLGLAILGLIVVYNTTSLSWDTITYKIFRRKSHEAISRYSNVRAEKWIVVTAISYPAQSIRFLANMPGWKVVVVGNKDAPNKWRSAGCIYLSLNEQTDFGFETVDPHPGDSTARKTIGYLFAIAHGAKVIYVADAKIPLDQLKTFVLEETMWGLSCNRKGFFNPYHHFGQRTIWPRSYPLSAIRENITANYKLNHYKTPSVQQGAVYGDLDLDVTFLPPARKRRSSLNVMFDRQAPPAIVPAGVFSSFHSQNTLFLYDALWALLIPASMKIPLCDVWRGYWAQRLLWEIGGNLGFFPPNAYQKKLSPEYAIHSVDDKNMSIKTEKLITFLTAWKCEQAKSFFGCMIALSTDMVNNDFWNKTDKQLTESWIRDLTAIGYKEPQRISFGSLRQGIRIIEKKLLPNETRFPAVQGSNVTFWAVENIPPLKDPKGESSLIKSHVLKMASFCNYTAANISRLSSVGSVKSFPNILLIIVFNFPHYDNLPILETVYKLYFPHILYCGPNKRAFDVHARWIKPATFIEVNVYRGWFAQNCLTKAMMMNYNVDGYLYIGDDTLLNVWNLHKLPWDKFWLYEGTIVQQSVKSRWVWYSKPDVGLLRYNAALEASKLLNRERFHNFFSRLANNTGHKDGFYQAVSDIAYVPKRFREDVIYFLDHFSKFNLFVEIAIPTVFCGLDALKNVYKPPGVYLILHRIRPNFAAYYKSTDIFLHPVKIREKRGRAFYCSTVFPLAIHGRQ